MWTLFLGSRPFCCWILLKSINLRAWSLKTKATWTFMNVVNWRKNIPNVRTSLLDASPQFDSLIYGGQPFKLAFHHRLLLCAAYCCQEIKEACKIELRHSTKSVNWELIQKEWENSKVWVKWLNISFIFCYYTYNNYTFIIFNQLIKYALVIC